MESGRAPIDIEVVQVLGYQRDAKGAWTLLLEMRMVDTVQGLCRLVFPTGSPLAGLRKFIADLPEPDS